jgi:dihydrofolate reductase
VRPRLTLIVARARNGVIGRDNALPWHLPEDLRHFRLTTTGHPILMGRRTFESIGRPLPGRRTIVVTRDPGWSHPGCERAGSLSEAIELAGQPGVNPEIATDEAFVIGGAQLYAEAVKIADRVLVTEVELEPEGDVYFDRPGPPEWTLRSSAPHRSASGLGYRITEWVRACADES